MNSRTAGKTVPRGSTAEECLRETHETQTPPEVRKFRRSNEPEPGRIRVHHGKAGDPDVSGDLIHGVRTKNSHSSSELLNPPRVTVFQEKLRELSEALYRSQQRAPLGRSYRQSGGLPPRVTDDTVFGVRNAKGLDVWELLNPRKSRAEVEREAQEGHELYLHSHNQYSVGERVNRKYELPHFSADSVFGLPTPHHDDGRNLAKTLKWIHVDETTEDETQLPAEGKEPATNSSQTFGIRATSDQYGAGEVIHGTAPGQNAQGPTAQRNLVHVIRHHLKKVNYHFFSSLLRAFRHYDKTSRGLIDLQDLEQVCREFQLETAPAVLQDLLHYCDLNGDGHIDFMEFANFLCWKDKMPIKTQEQKILTGERVSGSVSDGDSKPLLRPEDLEPVEPGKSLRVPRTLTRTRGDPDAFSPSSALIGAVADPKAATVLRSCGVPSVRTDLPPPRLKRVSDTTNYGDSPGAAAALLRPHVHAALGVHEQDFLCPRSKQEITGIFQSVGLDLSPQLMDSVWDLAAARSPWGDVSVEDFRNVLKEINAM